MRRSPLAARSATACARQPTVMRMPHGSLMQSLQQSRYCSSFEYCTTGFLLGVTSTILAGCAQDLEAQGDRPRVVKPLIVLADYHETYGPAEAWEAKDALLWCQISNLHPILISFGDPDLFEEVKQTKTREVFVESTSDEDLHTAFQVAGEFVQVRHGPYWIIISSLGLPVTESAVQF